MRRVNKIYKYIIRVIKHAIYQYFTFYIFLPLVIIVIIYVNIDIDAPASNKIENAGV